MNIVRNISLIVGWILSVLLVSTPFVLMGLGLHFYGAAGLIVGFGVGISLWIATKVLLDALNEGLV